MLATKIFDICDSEWPLLAKCELTLRMERNELQFNLREDLMKMFYLLDIILYLSNSESKNLNDDDE